MSHKHNEDSHFIPSPYKTVTSYENSFINDWNDSLSESMGDILKYIAKITVDKEEEIYENK